MRRLGCWIAFILATCFSLADGLRLSAGASDVDPHAYFNALAARADVWKAFSLRDQGQLFQYRHAISEPPGVNYLWPNDPDPRRQDAAKIVIPAGVVSLPNQLRLPMGTQDGYSYFVTWDAWYGAEMRYNNAQIINNKTFQFDSPRVVGGTPGIWFEIDNRWIEAPEDAGTLRARYYATESTPAGPGVEIEPFGPQVGTFTIKSQVWTRYWVLLDQKVGGDAWTRASLWIADETRDPVLILDRLPFTVFGGVDKFWFEYNTSTTSTPAGDRVSYVRNFVVLRNAGNVTGLLQRPLSNAPILTSAPMPPTNLRILQ